jgi:hypothetical protein
MSPVEKSGPAIVSTMLAHWTLFSSLGTEVVMVVFLEIRHGTKNLIASST